VNRPTACRTQATCNILVSLTVLLHFPLCKGCDVPGRCFWATVLSQQKALWGFGSDTAALLAPPCTQRWRKKIVKDFMFALCLLPRAARRDTWQTSTTEPCAGRQQRMPCRGSLLQQHCPHHLLTAMYNTRSSCKQQARLIRELCVNGGQSCSVTIQQGLPCICMCLGAPRAQPARQTRIPARLPVLLSHPVHMCVLLLAGLPTGRVLSRQSRRVRQ
jgi:hypothetical protein